MSDWNLPWEGGCRCGATRFRITEPPLMAAACHCTGCQTMSASAFSMTLTVPAGGFEVIAGEPVLGGLSRDMHNFCPSCMSWVFTRPTRLGQIVNVRPTMLDEHGWFVPYIEVCTSEKLAWATTPAVHRFERFPEVEEFMGLSERFAAEGARPG